MSRHRAVRALPKTPASRRLQQLGSKRPGPRIERADEPAAPLGERTRRGADLPPPAALSSSLRRREPPPQPAARASERASEQVLPEAAMR